MGFDEKFMKDFIKVTAAIITEDQKVLITQRQSDDEMGEKWEFPGGKIEPGETPEACLQRELQEELGIIGEVQELYAVSKHAYPDFHIELLAYNVTIRSGQITLHTHQDYRWVAIGELSMFDFSDADKPIVEKLKESSSVVTPPLPPSRGELKQLPRSRGELKQLPRSRGESKWVSEGGVRTDE